MRCQLLHNQTPHLLYLLPNPLIQLLYYVVLPLLRLHPSAYHALCTQRHYLLKIEYYEIRHLLNPLYLDVLYVECYVLHREYVLDLLAVGLLPVHVPGVSEDREVLVLDILVLPLLQLLLDEDVHRHLGHLLVRGLYLLNGLLKLLDIGRGEVDEGA